MPNINIDAVKFLLDRWNGGIYVKRWWKFRRVLLLRFCRLYMRNQGYHPVFDTDPTCMLHYAFHLKQKGLKKESEERMKKLIANPEYYLFDVNEKKSIFMSD